MTAPALAPPRSLLGYSDYSFWGYSLSDALEHVPTLLFPASIPVYAEMRKDPQLAAVLAGIMLPIRRATWQVDPAGCRPEVVQLVADDLGLPIVGQDEPGPARVRGVSWSEHLRAALNFLVYGFGVFELLADVSTGRARLAGLYERVPTSIAYLHSDANGDFGGITQVLRPEGKADEPEIPPDRLAHYVLDRQGAAHHGVSLLRPGYSSWFIKQDLRRVLATSHRRFATGVPTVEWSPGFNPTPQQMEQAQQAASAARVGEQSGMALPPGAHLVLTGLSGGVPNTIEALRWIDQQMSGMVLSRWMDLGSSQTGSRALGESFIDTFLLSIQALAEQVADTATRQIAARIVEWNWNNEPVPRITVADVGTRHEVTADALGALLSAGALSADPRLEEWVRRTYRLPERDPATPWQPPVAKGGPRSSGSVTDAMALAAAKPPRRRASKPPTGQLELPVAAAAADVTDELAAATADLQAEWPGIAEPMVADLAGQAGQAVEAGNLGVLGSLAVSAVVVAGVAAALGAAMSGLAATVAAALVTGRRKAPDMAGADRIGQLAQATAGILANVYASSAARAAMQQPGATAATVEAAVRTALEGLSTAQAGIIADHLGAAMHMSEGAALIAVCEQYPPKTLTVDENRDSPNCCDVCRAADGHVFPTLADALEIYSNGAQNVGCLGGSRCRGRLIPAWR